MLKEPRPMAEAVAGRFALTLQPAAHGDMSESFYPGVEDGDFNSHAEKIEGIAAFEVSEECIYI